ncbi:MAG TPA: aminoacyl-tRNA hydrolase [Flavitalea sp.]|nr:aminoacyl-tRNA hydrolase [Flavitalea sp.]
MSKFLIIGLGNPGADYAHTRHNIGFDIVDAFVSKHGGIFASDRLSDRTDLKIKGKQVIVIKPVTFMNLSGKAVKYWMEKESLTLENILVIVDELALPINRVRIRPSGSDAGHNGLKSIQETLMTDQYPRLRFGIGNDYPRGGQADYVLSRWKPEELPLIEKKVEKCVEIIESFVLAGITRTMNTFNKFDFTL